MESCELHLILQPSRLLEMRSYEILCPCQGSPSITLPIACRQCACFFLHMPRHHTAACIAMQLVTPSNSDKLPGSWVFHYAPSGSFSIFSTSTASKYLRFTTATSWKQIFSPHPIVVIFFSHKYWTSVNGGQQNKCRILTFPLCSQKIIKLP